MHGTFLPPNTTLLDCMLYLLQYFYDAGMSPGSAKQLCKAVHPWGVSQPIKGRVCVCEGTCSRSSNLSEFRVVTKSVCVCALFCQKTPTAAQMLMAPVPQQFRLRVTRSISAV